MEARSLLQTFAVDKNGQVRAVDEVARGLSCDCVCPCCGEAVIARQGEVRGWHFAHVSGADCGGAPETALHRAAKQALVDAGGMMIPEIIVTRTRTLPDGRLGSGTARQPGGWIDFESADPEFPMGTIRPDLAVVTGGKMLLVEIAVTHFLSRGKASVIEALAIPTIEIDLSSSLLDRWDWETVREIVVEGSQNKRWIQPMAHLIHQAAEAALHEALVQPLPEVVAVPTGKARCTRYWINGLIVDVRELPFGLAIWWPYQRVMDERLLRLMKELGARWQGKFRNWLVPLEAKAYLVEKLEEWSDRSPAVRA